MLVLVREIGEVFSIGDDVTVQILAVNGNQVRLGIEAPRHVKIHRAEVFKRITGHKLPKPKDKARQPPPMSAS